MAPNLMALWLCGDRAQKGDSCLCLPLSLGESCPLAPALIPHTSVSPCMPLVPFKLLLWFWSSRGVSLYKSICGFFKGNYLGLQKFLSPSWFLQAGVIGTSLPDTRALGWGAWLGLGLLTPEISFPNFYPTHMYVGPACSTSVPLLPVWMDVVSLFCSCQTSIELDF